jgi:hypothetical protein
MDQQQTSSSGAEEINLFNRHSVITNARHPFSGVLSSSACAFSAEGAARGGGSDTVTPAAARLSPRLRAIHACPTAASDAMSYMILPACSWLHSSSSSTPTRLSALVSTGSTAQGRMQLHCSMMMTSMDIHTGHHNQIFRIRIAGEAALSLIYI